LRQLGVILLVVVVWGALLTGYQRLTGGSDAEPMASQPVPTQIVAAPTDTPPATEGAPTAPPPTEAVSAPTAESDTSLPAVSFSADVFPILESRCVQCHGPSSARGGVKVDSYDAVMTIVTPGDAEASSLVTVVVSGDMPRRGPKLLPSEIEIISAWVNAGAPDN
jgi:mono/diheme cytochrome c family protein